MSMQSHPSFTMLSNLTSWLLLSISLRLVAGASLATAPNSGIHLAVSPKCGTLAGAPADVNAGLLALKSYKTLVTFGVS
jgi:hypothetical protein